MRPFVYKPSFEVVQLQAQGLKGAVYGILCKTSVLWGWLTLKEFSGMST